MTLTNQNRTRLLVEFFLLSVVSLFLELLIIRWMGADIRAFSVFKGFPLIACFIGLGVGFALPDDKPFRLSMVALAVFAASMKLAELMHVTDMPFPSLSVFYWHDMGSTPAEFWLKVAAFMLVIIYLVMGPFGLMVAIGSRLGQLFNGFKPLTSYCINITGAIVGSVSFTLLAFLSLSPGMLIVPAALIMLYYLPRSPRWLWAGSAVSTVVAIGLALWTIPLREGSIAYWSPYQRIDMVPMRFHIADGKTCDIGYQLCVNRAGYQQYTDWKVIDENKGALPAKIIEEVQGHARRCQFPFAVKDGKDVLVVGAGLGNDVAYALARGAGHVDAVEIDPIIMRLGKSQHPGRPYDSPKVRMVCNDARNFFKNCKERYDLIVFSHLDSHVTTTGSSVRIDNFVYTKESVAEALRLLKPDGLLVISYYSYKEWFNDRLFATISQAAGYSPLELHDTKAPSCLYFVLGPPVADKTYTVPPVLLEQNTLVSNHTPASVRVLTDDWPFLYITPGVVDIPYVLVVGELVLLALYASRKLIKTIHEPRRWQMFFLGAASLLLQLQAISRLSLVYGATWLTSAVVINGVLVMILVANLFVLKWANFLSRNLKPLYALLLLSLVLSYGVSSMASIDSSSIFGAGWLLTVMSLLPMLLAAIIFSTCFATVGKASHALAFNIFGAFIGAMLEYLSNYIGINGLLLVAVLLYVGSILAMPRTASQPVDVQPAEA